MDAIPFLVRMVEIESLSGEEEELAHFLAGAMSDMGFDARVDEAGNAVGHRRGPRAPDGRERTFVLLGHVDTVPGRIPVRVEEGVLHGRGSVDAKGALAAFVQAAARCEPAPGVTIAVIGAVEEEAPSSKGARHVAPLFRPEACLIGEPSGWDALTLGYKGCLRLELAVHSSCGHGAGPRGTAAERLFDLWRAIQDRATRFNANRPRLFDQLLPTLSSLHTESDGLTDTARAALSFRLPPGFDVAAFRRELAALASDEDSASRAELHFHGAEPAWSTPRSTPLARAFQRSLAHRGRALAFKHKTGTSDLNVLGPIWRCPIAAYGPGDSLLDHTPDERLPLPDYLRSIDLLTAALQELGAAR